MSDDKLRTVIEGACEEFGLTLKDLTVLSKRVDPYRRDTPAGHRDGQWIRDQFHRLYGEHRSTHWRGLHYAITMAGGIIKPNGDVYVNNYDNWLWLSETAAKAAKWLGYIPFDRINDERNSEPIIHRTEKTTPSSGLAIRVYVEIPDVSQLRPYPIATGFEVRQAYHFVIFGEKSSLESIALPVARRYQADLYIPTGEISDTLIHQIARDAAADGRPLVLFTLSDCDPSGWQMPISIARKLQALKDLFFPELRFEVVRGALLPEQAKRLRLPESPLKDEEKRASRWREAFDIEQTEIDALTTPERAATLRQLLEDAFAPYIDSTLERRVEEARRAWEDEANRRVRQAADHGAIAEVRREAAAKLDELRREIDDLNQRLRDATREIRLPRIEVPEPENELDPSRETLVSLDADWRTATEALIRAKAYGKEAAE
jgi:hypothetical protein